MITAVSWCIAVENSITGETAPEATTTPLAPIPLPTTAIHIAVANPIAGAITAALGAVPSSH